MKLIKPSYEILEQGPGLDGIYGMIELAGRTCYRSKRPEGKTAKDFVDMMIKRGHRSMLEHGTVYLAIPHNPFSSISDSTFRYRGNPYSKVVNATPRLPDTVYVTTNLRVLVENDWLDDLQYLCEPTEYHEKRITVKFTTSNGIMREFTRHRTMSFAVESTRYCNYSKDRFGNELTFIIPSWYKEIPCLLEDGTFDANTFYNTAQSVDDHCILNSLKLAEDNYLTLINLGGYKPQEAREVLPLATKCDMVVTGFVSDWQHLFNLRTSIIAETGQPHPDCSNLIDPLYNEFIDKKLI